MLLMAPPFKEKLNAVNPSYSRFDTLKTLQVNLGNLCNLICTHCHIEASPSGMSIMGRSVMEKIAGFLADRQDIILDITGGCPEMNPHFRYFVEETRGLAKRRIVRSNLAILMEPGMEWLPEFYRDQALAITASLPCYLKENVDNQRGSGSYDKSIAALMRLNAVGYGDVLELNLVHNPAGPFIPASQKGLADAYRKELHDQGIRFHDLYTITNAPIGRFRKHLDERGTYEVYLDKLAGSFNPDAAEGIMCRTLVSVGWNGLLYNCDFNLAIGLPITGEAGAALTIDDLALAARKGKELVLSQHCYSCTAAEGSSCTGALALQA